ncbi:hypothetical protein ACWC5I_36005 [Kitasatospora sp. NPDC001574]
METPPTTRPTVPDHPEHLEQSEEFRRLRRSFRGFAFPATAGFILWYEGPAAWHRRRAELGFSVPVSPGLP